MEHPSVERNITTRQLEIVELLTEGLTNQEIAERLVLTTGTVENHVQHILARLQLRNRVQLAVWYTRRSLSNGSCACSSATQEPLSLQSETAEHAV